MKKKWMAIIVTLILCLPNMVYAVERRAEELSSVSYDTQVNAQFNELISASSVESRYTAIEKNLHGINVYLNAVETFNKNLINQRTEDIAATITFNQFVDFDVFSQFADQLNLDIVQIQLSAKSSTNERITFFSKVSHGLTETERIIRRQCEDENFVMNGIVAAYAIVDSEQLKELTSNDMVLLVDTTGDETFVSTYSASTSTSSCQDEFAHSLAWTAESLGMYN